MSFETILCRKPAAQIAEIRLNRPERLNAVYETVVEELSAALAEAGADPEVRVVILAGEGRAFCAGADYKRHGTRSPSARLAYLHGMMDICRRLRENPKPIIAAVHGFAVGVGAEMAVNCDFLLMCEGAEIGFPEAAIGTFVGGGVTTLLPRIIGLPKARELIMTCDRVTAADAVALGLANRCFPEASFRDDVQAFATRLATRAPVAVALAKRHLNAGIARDYDGAVEAELGAVLECMATEDWQEGVRAFAEKRPPRFTGR